MTLQQMKVKKFADAIEEFHRFKAEWKRDHPEASEEEYMQAITQKARELDL